MKASPSFHAILVIFTLGSAILGFGCSAYQQVTVFLNDGTQTTGVLLAVSDTSVTLPPLSMPAGEYGSGFSRTIPRAFSTSEIQHVTLNVKKTDFGSEAIRNLGTILGIVGGVAAVWPTADRAYNDPIYIIGGAVLGGALGAEITNSLTREKISLDPKIPQQRDSLKVYAKSE